MIAITDTIAIPDDALEERFIRASGPGGQNVNQVATAVQLRFDVAGSPHLPEAVKARALALAGTRATKDGEIVITAREHRTQERNREAARARLVALLRQAAARPKRRIPTRASKASQVRRRDAKTKRGTVKRLRGPVRHDD